MNRSTHRTTALLFQQPARLIAVVIAALLLLMGGVPMAERLVAHLTVWTASAPVPGLAWLLPFTAGASALFLTLGRRSGTADEAHPQKG
ncbi:hypothetical protein [Streptomyces canus]|uniref:ABC transporter permease n=1 Tax=Streptomyces canus TaxID=58343 RepID=A0AAW8FUQ6_9ACTN|nr:hypothetical protein [Streptomyces canus]MDQ0757602.1 hypothetical protein [Streptomyces canus]MDQ0913542.1 hypothetical protein [Streptomyces canus]MDQ1073702.1 hypothetical protein [Streptomyces canus]